MSLFARRPPRSAAPMAMKASTTATTGAGHTASLYRRNTSKNCSTVKGICVSPPMLERCPAARRVYVRRSPASCQFDSDVGAITATLRRRGSTSCLGTAITDRTMNRLVACALFALASTPVHGQTPDDRLRKDWADLARYRDANAKL